MYILSQTAFVGTHIGYIKKLTADDIKTTDVLRSGREKRSDLFNDNSNYQDYTMLKIEE